MRNRSTAVSAWLSWASRHRNLLWKIFRPGLETTLQFIFLTCSLFSLVFASRGNRESARGSSQVALWVWGLSLPLMLWCGCWCPCQGVGQLRMPCHWFAAPGKWLKDPTGLGSASILLPCTQNQFVFICFISWVLGKSSYEHTFWASLNSGQPQTSILLCPDMQSLEDQTASDSSKPSKQGAGLDTQAAASLLRRRLWGQKET